MLALQQLQPDVGYIQFTKTENFMEIFSIVFQLPFQVRKSMARIKVVIAERVSRVESYRGPWCYFTTPFTIPWCVVLVLLLQGKAIKEAEKILRRREKQKELANIQSQADSAQNIEKQVSQWCSAIENCTSVKPIMSDTQPYQRNTLCFKYFCIKEQWLD